MPGGIASLVADDPESVDRRTADVAPGTAGAASTQYVDPPAFGETGPAVTSAFGSSPPEQTTVVASTDDSTVAVSGESAQRATPPPTAPLAGSSYSSSRSTGIMIAAVVLAAVVIVGGVSLLFFAGSGDDETAGSDEAREPAVESAGEDVAPVANSAGESVDAIEPATSEVIVTTETVPTETVSTEGSTPETVLETTLPSPTRGAGDLGLTQPILDEACDGRYITFVGSAVGDRPYGEVVDELLGLYPGTNYVWTKACPSLRQEFSNGADIYGVVFGPYATQQEACDARAFGPQDAYVRRISTSDPEDHTVSC